jgi:hypothetical protein
LSTWSDLDGAAATFKVCQTAVDRFVAIETTRRAVLASFAGGCDVVRVAILR